MKLINTGKYILKSFFSEPGTSVTWVSSSFIYFDKLEEQNKQSLIDIHYKNDGADIPLAFINLAKLGLHALSQRQQKSDRSLELKNLDEEFFALKQKIDAFIVEHKSNPDQIKTYHRELNALEKQLKKFSKRSSNKSKGFFSSKSANKKEKSSKTSKKTSGQRPIVLFVTLMVISLFVFYRPISTFFWKIFISPDIQSISTELNIAKHSVDGRKLTLYISQAEINSKPYSELNDILNTILKRSFEEGFENFTVKNTNNVVVAKNILIDNKPSLYLYLAAKP